MFKINPWKKQQQIKHIKTYFLRLTIQCDAIAFFFFTFHVKGKKIK